MVYMNPAISVINVNINDLNMPITRQRFGQSESKNKTQLYAIYKKPTLYFILFYFIYF